MQNMATANGSVAAGQRTGASLFLGSHDLLASGPEARGGRGRGRSQTRGAKRKEWQDGRGVSVPQVAPMVEGHKERVVGAVQEQQWREASRKQLSLDVNAEWVHMAQTRRASKHSGSLLICQDSKGQGESMVDARSLPVAVPGAIRAPSKGIVSAAAEAFDPQDIVDSMELAKIDSLGIAAEDYRGLLRPNPHVLAIYNNEGQIELKESEDAFGVDDSKGRNQLAITFNNPQGAAQGPETVITTPQGEARLRGDMPPLPTRNVPNSPYAQLHVLEAKIAPSNSLIPKLSTQHAAPQMKPRRQRRKPASKKQRNMSYHINEDLKDLIVVNKHPCTGPKEPAAQSSAAAARKDEEHASSPQVDVHQAPAGKAAGSWELECFNIVAIGNQRAYSSLRSPSSAEVGIAKRPRGAVVLAGRVPPATEPATEQKIITGLRSSNVSSTQQADAGRGSSRGHGNESVTGGSYSSSIRKVGNETLVAHVIGKRVGSRQQPRSVALPRQEQAGQLNQDLRTCHSKKKQNQKRNRILDQRNIFMCEKTGAHFKLGELGLSLLTVAKMKADQKKEGEEELVLDQRVKYESSLATAEGGTSRNTQAPKPSARGSQILESQRPNPQPTHGFTNRYRRFDESNIEAYFETSISTAQSPAVSTARAAARLSSAFSRSANESGDDDPSPVNWSRVVEVDLNNLDAMVHQIQKKKDKVLQEKEEKLQLIYELEFQEQNALNAQRAELKAQQRDHLLKLLKEAENLASFDSNDKTNDEDDGGDKSKSGGQNGPTASEGRNLGDDGKRVTIESSNPRETPLRSKKQLLQFYIDDLLKMPLFSNFVSQKKNRKEAMLGSKRLSLDSIGTASGSRDNHKKIKILIPDRIAKQQGGDVEVLVSTAMAREGNALDYDGSQEYAEKSFDHHNNKKDAGEILARLQRKKTSTPIHTQRMVAAGEKNAKKVQIKAPSTKDSAEDQATTERESIITMKPQFKPAARSPPKKVSKKPRKRQEKAPRVPTTAPISVLNMAQQLMTHDLLNIAHEYPVDQGLYELALDEAKNQQQEQSTLLKKEWQKIKPKDFQIVVEDTATGKAKAVDANKEAQVDCVTPHTHPTQPLSPPSQYSVGDIHHLPQGVPSSINVARMVQQRPATWLREARCQSQQNQRDIMTFLNSRNTGVLSGGGQERANEEGPVANLFDQRMTGRSIQSQMQNRTNRTISRQAPLLQAVVRPPQMSSRATGSALEPIATEATARPSDMQSIGNQYGCVSRAEEIVLSSTAKVIQSRNAQPSTAHRNILKKMARLAPHRDGGKHSNQRQSEAVDASNVIDHSRLNQSLLNHCLGNDARGGKGLPSTEPQKQELPRPTIPTAKFDISEYQRWNANRYSAMHAAGPSFIPSSSELIGEVGGPTRNVNDYGAADMLQSNFTSVEQSARSRTPQQIPPNAGALTLDLKRLNASQLQRTAQVDSAGTSRCGEGTEGDRDAEDARAFEEPKNWPPQRRHQADEAHESAAVFEESPGSPGFAEEQAEDWPDQSAEHQ